MSDKKRNPNPNIDKSVKDIAEDVADEQISKAQLPKRKPLDNAPATTTAEQDLEAAEKRVANTLKTLGQRKINLLWEATQAAIAVMITGAVIYSALTGIKSEILNTAFVLVISMYLVRTNHIKTGGIGGTDSKKDTR